MLEILRRYGVRATFYEIGNNATIWPGYAQQVVAEGHLIGNHSFTHPNFTKITSASQRSQLDRASDELVKDTGIRPCWFRPPGRSLSSSARAIIRYYRDHGYRFVDLNGHSGLKPLPANRSDHRKSPHGHVIHFTGGVGTITATGWAVDPDSATPVTIRAQAGSKWSSATTVADRSLAAVPQTTTAAAAGTRPVPERFPRPRSAFGTHLPSHRPTVDNG